MKIIKIIILLIFFLILAFVSYILQKKLDENGKNLNGKLNFIFLFFGMMIINVLIALPFNYKGYIQEKFDNCVDWMSTQLSKFFERNENDEIPEPDEETDEEAEGGYGDIGPYENESGNEDSQIEETKVHDIGEGENETQDVSKIEEEKQQIFAPDLIGKDEATATNICTQNGFKYSIEYYLGGDGFVISQSPTSTEGIEEGGNITINIGISQNDFSNRLLELINEKRRTSGLEDLSFSEQLNIACSILAQENVNSVDCTRPDGSHWSSVLWENGILLNDGVFTSRNNITSLSDANGRIKYAGNSYGDGNLLTASYTLIGMAYTSNNSLLIIVGN